MSPLFLSEFRGTYKCAKCASQAHGTKSLCEVHLASARQKWHGWVATRQTKGLCITCHRKHVPGEQRCRTHKKVNREKCRAWGATHKEHLHAYYLGRRNERISAGMCPGCGKRSPMAEHTRCVDCVTRKRASDRRRGRHA